MAIAAADPVSHVVGHRRDVGLAPQVVIQRVVQAGIESEDRMNARALHVGVDHRDPSPATGQIGGHVRSGVALARPAAERVDRNDSGHAPSIACSQCRCLLTPPLTEA